MLKWLSEHYATATEQLAAARSAVGPLRLSKAQLFRLLVRKTMHDLRLYLDEIRSPSTWTLTAALTVLCLVVTTIFISTRLLGYFHSQSRKLGLPTLHMRRGWDYPTLLKEGAEKYPDTPYIITYTGYEYVVFPSSSFEEVKRLNASRASMIDWFTTVFWQGWAFLGTDNSARYHTVGIDLARALPSRVWMRQDDACAAFNNVLGGVCTGHAWTTVSLWDTVQKIVAIMNATGLLGQSIGTDPRWHKATKRLHNAIMFGIVGSHLTPRVLRPLVAALVFLPAKLVDWHMQSILQPMVEKELSKYEQSQLEDQSKHAGNERVNGGLYQSINETFPLTTWLMDRYKSKDGKMGHLLRDHVVIAFEAATTSAGMLYFMFAELAVRPELVAELREEVTQTLDHNGHLPLGYLGDLRKMDSFMLESARMTASSHLALFRRVQKPLQLSIGPELPPGTLICIDAYHVTKHATRYENADTFDSQRFLKMRQEPGHEEMHHFTLPGADNTIWGGGTQACPGRSFAAMTMKLVLAHLLIHYEIQLLPDGTSKPKRNSMPNGSISPDTKAKVMIRERTQK